MMKIEIGITICPLMSYRGEGAQYCTKDCAGFYYPYGKEENGAYCGYIPDGGN